MKKIPLVEKIYFDLLSKIKSGEFKNGCKLPTEMELCNQFGVSRITAQNAVLRLVEDGLVTRNKRGGSIVGKVGSEKQVVIPIVLPYVDNMTHGFLYGAQKKALEFGYTVKPYNSEDDILSEKKILQRFILHPPPALIIYPCSQFANIPAISRLSSMNVPMVFVDREIVGTDSPLITSNNAEVMFELTCKIIKKGYKKLSFYGFFNDMLSPTKDRLNGFCMAHVVRKLPIRDNFFITSQEALDDVLRSNNRPEVICCLHDHLAYDVMRTANALGIHIPRDLGVTGFDNRIPPAVYSSSLTTVEQNFYEIGTAAVTATHELLSGLKPPRRTKIKAQIILRDSVKKL